MDEGPDTTTTRSGSVNIHAYSPTRSHSLTMQCCTPKVRGKQPSKGTCVGGTEKEERGGGGNL